MPNSPACFAVTGMTHWETLVRARAVENLSYVIAAAQGGYHANGRETYGDSMIVDPWGVVLDRLPRGSGVVSAAGNRRALRIEEEPLDGFRRYMSVYAREQAHCHFSPALISNLETYWVGSRAGKPQAMTG